MPFAEMLSQTITMLDAIEQDILSAKALMNRVPPMPDDIWEDIPDSIKIKTTLLVAMNHDAEKYALSLKNYGASSGHQVQFICDQINDMATMAKELSTFIKGRDGVWQKLSSVVLMQDGILSLNNLPTVLVFEELHNRDDASQIFGKYLPIVNEICKSIHLIVEIYMALKNLGWASSKDADAPKEFDLTEARMSLRRQVELDYHDSGFDQYNGDMEATDKQFIDKIRLIMGAIAVTPPWKNPEQYGALMHTPHLLRKLYDVIQNEPGDGWSHFIEVMASYPNMICMEGNPND